MSRDREGTPYTRKLIKPDHLIEHGVRLVLDVVCGMEIDDKTVKWKSEYKDKTYYFCGPMCKLEFDENPEKYVLSGDTGKGK